MKHLVKRMKEKKLALPVLIITLIFIILTIFIPAQNLSGGIIPSSKLNIDNAAYSYVSPNGLIYAVDDSCSRLICITRTKNIEYVIVHKNFGAQCNWA